MATSTETTRRWLSFRVRLTCLVVFLLSSLFPPYVPKAILAAPDSAPENQQFLLVEDGFIMKSSSLTREGARRAYAQGVLHIVKEGESLERLARRYEISANTIRWANDLQAGLPIQPGDELLILPVDGVLHNVTRGQTLLRIAQLYDIQAADIIEQNNLDSGFILAGQELIIPGGSPIVGKRTQVATADPPDTVAPDPVKPADPKPATPVKPTGPGQPVITGTSDQIIATDVTYGVLQKPCSAACFITQYYHAGHYALDLQERGGGNIYSAEAGTITRSDYGWNGGYGNVIEIDHGNGLVTVYAHNKQHYVKEGDIVARGDIIAFMGNTGRVYGSTGIHTHFEVRLKGIKKNPLLYIQ